MSPCFASNKAKSHIIIVRCSIFCLFFHLQQNHLQILRNEKISVEILSSLFGIELFSLLNVPILRVVEDHIPCSELLRKLRRIGCRGVVFLIGLENICL